jgi:hypothetical protein
MADYLVFQTQQAAQAALEVIYSNMVESINSPDLINVATGQVVPKDDLTPDQAVQVTADNRHFPIFGVNAATGEKDTQQGYTTAWTEAQKTVQGKWVFAKPADALMDGVLDYTVEPYDPAWFPSEDIVDGL